MDSQNFLSFAWPLHLLHQILTAPFQPHQSVQLCIPPRQTDDEDLLLFLPEDLEDPLASLIPCLFGNVHDRNTCFFRRFQLLFQFTNAHFQIFSVLQIFQHSPRRTFIGGTTLSLIFLLKSLAFLPSFLLLRFPLSLTIIPSPVACD